MDAIWSWAGYIVLFLCFNGYFLFLKHKLNIKMEFVPVLTCTGIMIVLIAAGAVMKLKWGALVLVLCGIGLFANEVVDIVRKKVSLPSIFDKRTIAAYVSFFALTTYYLVYFKGHYLTGYDTFTHWGAAVKIMLYNDRLPAQWDVLTWHSSYPTGAQGFEYFLCRVTNDWSDGMMLSAQAILFMSCIIALTAVCRNYIVLIPVALVSCTLLRDIVYSLSVDIMLAFFCASGFAMILYYKREVHKRWWLIAVMISVLPVIKVAGFYHFLILLIWFSIIYFGEKGSGRKQKAIRYVAFLVILAIPYLIWTLYLNTVSPASLNTRHAFSVQYMQYISNIKSEESIAQQARDFWNSLTDMNQMRGTLISLGISAGIGLLSVFTSTRGERKHPIIFVALILVSFALYNAFLLGMYLYEMPETSLGSFGRYQNIHNVMILLMSVVLFISTIRSLKDMRYQTIPVIVV